MMTVRELLDRKYPTWNSNPLMRAAVCTLLMRAGYNLDEHLPPESIKAAKAIIHRAKQDPPKMHKVDHQRMVTAGLQVGVITKVVCKVCTQPTIIAKLATGDDAYYCPACKAVIGTLAHLQPAL